MNALEAALAYFDLSLAALVTGIALYGARTEPAGTRDPVLLQQALRRVRSHFAILTLAWTLTLVSFFLLILFQPSRDELAVLVLASNAVLLLLVLAYEASLYGTARPLAPDEPAEWRTPGPGE